MKQDKKTEYSGIKHYNQAKSRLVNIQKERMKELEKKLGINCTTKKIFQPIEIVNNGKAISDSQVQKQNDTIKRMSSIKKLDFILETNNQKVIELYYKLKLQN